MGVKLTVTVVLICNSLSTSEMELFSYLWAWSTSLWEKALELKQGLAWQVLDKLHGQGAESWALVLSHPLCTFLGAFPGFRDRYFIIFKCKETFLKSGNAYSSPSEKTLPGDPASQALSFYSKTLPKSLLDRIATQNKKKNAAFSWKVSLKGSDLGSALRSTWSAVPLFERDFHNYQKEEDSSGRNPGRDQLGWNVWLFMKKK